jgi:uncharacterized protein (DUF488 family)
MKPSPPPRVVYTIGHSTRSVDELIEILCSAHVDTLVDIRTIPRSRTNPQFNQEIFPRSLAAAKITYVHLAALGGLRHKSKTVDPAVNAGWRQAAFHNFADYAETSLFHEGLNELLRLASQEICAIMCAEAVWWRCHRRIVADHLLAHGMSVIHLFARDKAEPATLTPFAVIRQGARVSYPEPP